MNCVIIDDEKTCKTFQEFILTSGSANLVGTAEDIVSGMKYLTNRNIDVIFVDYDKLSAESVSLINSLDYRPNIILMSGTDQYASKVFDINVIDYILKPVSYERFYKSIDKVLRYYIRKESLKLDDSIFIKRDSSLIKLDFKDIVYIEALENYVILNTKTDKFTIHFTMKAIEDHLPPDIFIRIHRSFIVNKKMIKAIHSNSLDLEFRDLSRTLPIGNSYKDGLFRHIIVLER